MRWKRLQANQSNQKHPHSQASQPNRLSYQNQQNQSNHQNQSNQNPCRPCYLIGLEYLGNIFLLGLATLVLELVDLQAASALEVLLQPFQSDDGDNLEQDILGADLEDVDVLDFVGEGIL